MNQRDLVTDSTIIILQEIRGNARYVRRKEAELKEVNANIDSNEAKIKSLKREYEALESETGRQDILQAIRATDSTLKTLDNLSLKLGEEARNHNTHLLYFRERLEDVLWRALVESGHLNPKDDMSDVVSDPLSASMGGSCPSSDGHQRYVGQRNEPDAEKACVANQAPNNANSQLGKAESELWLAKEDLEAALASFHHLDRLCNTQRREFDKHMIPEWADMSRTEFDLEQLKQKLDLTRELIRAEKAYSEAGRLAKGVGFIREDADQSCHFVDDLMDGACSGDVHATPVGEKHGNCIEAWRRGVEVAGSEASVSGEGDIWEVDTVYFGEGCSTHANEWNKTRIGRWDELRETEWVKMCTAGNLALPDGVLCQHSPPINGSGVSSVVPIPVEHGTRRVVLKAMLWEKSAAILKVLLVSGLSALAKFSATWSASRASDKPIQ